MQLVQPRSLLLGVRQRYVVRNVFFIIAIKVIGRYLLPHLGSYTERLVFFNTFCPMPLFTPWFVTLLYRKRS